MLTVTVTETAIFWPFLTRVQRSADQDQATRGQYGCAGHDACARLAVTRFINGYMTVSWRARASEAAVTLCMRNSPPRRAWVVWSAVDALGLGGDQSDQAGWVTSRAMGTCAMDVYYHMFWGLPYAPVKVRFYEKL
jgi:hypothetical protein